MLESKAKNLINSSNQIVYVYFMRQNNSMLNIRNNEQKH